MSFEEVDGPAVRRGTGAMQVPLQAAQPPTTVMSRNLYLGADIGAALDLLPDLPAAGELLWSQVSATDFPTRAAQLAEEVVQFNPAVIGLQEAARWRCRTSLLDSPTVVLDFTEELLAAVAAAGTDYVVASADGRVAANPGFRIGPLPFVTMTDPDRFLPLFGQPRADCGFEIGDVLLVRGDLATAVQRVGTSEFEARETIVPTVLAIDRGYAWADIEVGGTTARFVTTHLESIWHDGAVPVAAEQARQLVDDLAATTGPLVVMGDFNSDHRDPRPRDTPNPADQPIASQSCPRQPTVLTVQDARAECSPYWVMRKAGFVSAGPDDFAPEHFSYGASDLLAGPDPDRLRHALQQGNPYGFTDRLDYVFVRNGVRRDTAEVVGNIWPNGPTTWPCSSPEQIADTAAAGAVLAQAGRPAPPAGVGVCLASDHAGIVASLLIDPGRSTVDDPPPIEHTPFRWVWWHLVLGLVLLLILVGRWRLRRRRRRKAVAQSMAT